MLAMLLLVALSAGPAVAETDAPEDEPSTPLPRLTPQDEALLSSLQLPVLATSLRAAGVDAAEVEGVLGALREAGVAAPDAADVLRRTLREARGSGGTFRGVGRFVQAKLQEGLRGPALGEAIRAEHQAYRASLRAKARTPAGAWPGPTRGPEGAAAEEATGEPPSRAERRGQGAPGEAGEAKGRGPAAPGQAGAAQRGGAKPAGEE